MARCTGAGSSLAVFFFFILTCPLVIPVASSPHNKQETIPPEANPTTTNNYNGTITFKGDWSWKDRPEIPVSRKEGSVIFQLTFSPSEREGMHNVHGKLLARNGKYLTDYDATMLLEGVYMEELGRLEAVAEPLIAVELVSGNHNSTSSKNGKSSVTNSNGTFTRKESEDIVVQSAELRKAAEKLLRVSESEAEEMLRAEEEEKERNSTVRDASWKNITTSPCRFFLQLNFQRKLIAEATGAKIYSRETENNTIRDDSFLSPLPPGALTGTSISSTTITDTYSTVSVSGLLRTLRCGFSISIIAAPVDTAAYAAKASHYSTLITIVGLLQIALTLRQLEATSSTTAASRMSLLSLGQQAVQDALLCLLHLTLAIMVDPLFTSFITAACVQFCLFGIFELRMLLLTWRARRRGLVDPWTLQRELTTVYARFSCCATFLESIWAL